MANYIYELLTARQIQLIKSRCRKFGFRADQVDDCFQQLALKILQSKDKKTYLKSKVIDNHIKSQLLKEMRYQTYLIHLREGFQEAIVYPLHLQIDVQCLISTMTNPKSEICKLLAAGFTHKEISAKLEISPRTIRREVALIKQLFINYYYL